MTIQITPVDIITTYGTVSVSSLKVREVVDRNSEKTILVTFINGASKVLWNGEQYDGLNWTDSDVEARVQELATMEWVREILF